MDRFGYSSPLGPSPSLRRGNDRPENRIPTAPMAPAGFTPLSAELTCRHRSTSRRRLNLDRLKSVLRKISYSVIKDTGAARKKIFLRKIIFLKTARMLSKEIVAEREGEVNGFWRGWERITFFLEI